MLKTRPYYLIALVALALSTFLIFQNLASPAIRQWDEAIYADNALDMYYTGDPIVLRRNGEVTLYNTKPPLVIWLQTLSLHVFGVNEFAIRFPSAMAGVLTCVTLLVFSVKTLKDIRIGIVAVLALGTTYGFVKQHVVKTGDLDAVLVMWTTLYALVFMHLLLAGSGRTGQLIVWTGIGVIGAFLTKGIAGLIPLAGLGICALVAKRFLWLIKRIETYLIIILALLTAIGYYALRESLAPGYFDRTLKIDFGRYTTDYLSWHHHPWYYYVRNWYALEFFMPYIFWLPVALALGLSVSNYYKPTLLFAILAMVFIAVLSFPKVKLMWYDAPAYPWLSLICAIGFVALWDRIQKKFKIHGSMAQWLFGAALVCIFAIPVKNMYERNATLYLPVDIMEEEGFFVRELHRERPEIKQYKVLMMAEQNAHFTQLDFYLNAYNRHKGYDLTHLRDTSDVRSGDTIAVCQERQYNWLREKYRVDEIFNGETGCRLVVLD